MGFFKKIFKKDSSGIPPAPDFPPKEENIDRSVPPAPDPFSTAEIPAPNIDAPQQNLNTAEDTMQPAKQVNDESKYTSQYEAQPENPQKTEDSAPYRTTDDEDEFPAELEDPLSETQPKQEPPSEEPEEDDYEYEPERITEGPIFCKVHVYRDILEEIDHSLNKCKGCTEISKRINEVRIEDDKELDKWKNILLDAYRKIHYIDKIIFEGEKR